MSSNHYHYIITGAGCAGLSLLMRMMSDPFFSDKRILVLDQAPKIANDRTWCFWEKEPGIFESIVHHQWDKVQFLSDGFCKQLDLGAYQYKMIQGIDFYQQVIQKATECSNVTFRYETVLTIANESDKAIVNLAAGKVSADFIFNSIPHLNEASSTSDKIASYQFLQHFTGWVIETTTPCFDEGLATFMDFRISQEQGTSFMYVLPTSSTTALVEYTLFTPSLLPPEAYSAALKLYISNTLNISAYQIKHEEIGVIPMTNQKFNLQNKRIVNMGIAGGQAKGSSGYAFQFIQKRTAALVKELINQKTNFNKVSFNQQKGSFYDSVLLHVLHHHKMPGDKIFAAIFKKNKTETVLRFLDNESTLVEDLQIMSSVPTSIFLPAAFQELFH